MRSKTAQKILDETPKDNEIIAEFMGFTKSKSSLGNTWEHPDKMGVYGGVGQKFKYDTSWDWLMPVVEKIKKMQHNPDEMFMGTTIERYLHFIAVTEKPITTPIKFLFDEIVEFIKWYNGF